VQRRPFRALLFVPGTRPELFEKACRSGADALVLDLEDAVAEGAKADARAGVSAAIEDLGSAGVGVFVRINDLSTRHWRDDLGAVVRLGLTGVALPKVQSSADVRSVDDTLGELERDAGLAVGEVDIQPLLETARGLHDAFDVLSASSRIRSCWAGFARDGDVSRELDARWTPSGEESVYLRSKVLLDARAAGVPYPISGTWADLQDHAGLARYAEQNRNLGYTGMYVIHPSHVPVVTEAFTPTPTEVERYRMIITTLDEAEQAGQGVAQLDGVMIDRAMVARARALLDAFDPVPSAPEGGGR
jgi:citrate lyase subunit beta / citryl-CoA lyase